MESETERLKRNRVKLFLKGTLYWGDIASVTCHVLCCYPACTALHCTKSTLKVCVKGHALRVVKKKDKVLHASWKLQKLFVTNYGFGKHFNTSPPCRTPVRFMSHASIGNAWHHRKRSSNPEKIKTVAKMDLLWMGKTLPGYFCRVNTR